MKAILGYDAGARKSGRVLAIEWDSEKLVNAHILIAGMSGAGKTHTIRKMIESMLSSSSKPLRFHIFDVHGDIKIPGASSISFSEQGSCGLNPLKVSADPKFGGLRNQIQLFIDTINRVSSSPLGVKQISVIRNLLYDVYEMHGFKRDDPATWRVVPGAEVLVNSGADNRLFLNVPITEKEDAKALGAKWDRDVPGWWVPTDKYVGSITKWLPKTVGRSHPTVEAVLIYARRLLQMSFMGADQAAIMHLELFHRAAASYQRRAIDKMRMGNTDWSDLSTREAVDKAGVKAVTSYADYVESVSTGMELDNLMKYDSTEVLKSVVDRLETVVGTGLFKNKPLAFDPAARVWRYELDALLRAEEKKMFVFFRLEELWAQARERGHSEDVQDVFILDEFGLYASAAQDQDHVINVLARESRKYGISLIAAGQDPDAFPESFISSIGTKIILGVDELYWRSLTSKMRIDDALLQWIKLQKTIAVQFKEKSSTRNEWRWVHLS